MVRNIILRKDIDNRYIEGYFVTEEKYKRKKKTIIEKVKGDKLYRKVDYLDKDLIENQLIADEFIKSLPDDYKIIKDEIIEYGKTGFRIIDNITGKVIYNYNYEK